VATFGLDASSYVDVPLLDCLVNNMLIVYLRQTLTS